uniref:OTU domain-containing protein n=1 Tax=Biomphalaria glabrata TaxID=6526 RepID=A0A2C9JTH1_BIOGL
MPMNQSTPYLRRSIVHFIHNYKDYFHPYVEEGDVEKHLENMKKDGYWGTEAELYALATILKANIYVYTPNASTYRWILLEPLFECDTLVTGFEQTQVCKYLTVCFTNGNHYDSVLPVKDCNCCLAPPRLEGKEASSTLSKGQNVMNALPQCSCNLKALDSREEPFSCQFKSTFKNEAEDLPSSKRSSEGQQCSVAPPIPVHSLRVEDQAKRSFSDVLFDDIKSFKRTIYNKDCQENELKKEINQWKDRSDWFEAQLDNEQQKAKDKKDRLHKTYVSMSCCSCTHHLDSLERRPYLLDCGHVACGVCTEKSFQEILLCRTCGKICHAQSEKVFEIVLIPIMWIEKELLDLD